MDLNLSIFFDKLKPYTSNMSSQGSDIVLYTAQTPNGVKISITLEELGYWTFFEMIKQLGANVPPSASHTKYTKSSYRKTLKRNLGFSKSIPMAASPP
jgi:hypothetical protein